MQEILAVASLVLFAALAIAFFSILARAGRVVADTRVEDAFRRDAAALADRVIDHLGEAAAKIDRVRRRLDPPALLDEILPPVLEALEGLRAEADDLQPPPGLLPLRERLTEELERASRATETVRHGGVLLGYTSGRPRELEGETSIKRGYLNLLHAREALQELAADLRSGRVDARRWFTDRHADAGTPK
jgi:hypothetical protein